MKRIFLCILLCFLLMFTSACHGAEKGTVSSAPQSFSAAESGIADAKSIMLKSHITGAEIMLHDAAALEEIISAAKLLNGSNPISSRGYYGGSYSLSFYETAELTEDAQPYLNFTLFCAGENEAYVVSGLYETVNGHDYSAMYPVSIEDVKALDAILAQYID